MLIIKIYLAPFDGLQTRQRYLSAVFCWQQTQSRSLTICWSNPNQQLRSRNRSIPHHHEPWEHSSGHNGSSSLEKEVLRTRTNLIETDPWKTIVYSKEHSRMHEPRQARAIFEEVLRYHGQSIQPSQSTEIANNFDPSYGRCRATQHEDGIILPYRNNLWMLLWR